VTTTKVFGPPGSGKTTYLLGVVEQELERGILPIDMGYFAFTRKAATEARERPSRSSLTLMMNETSLGFAHCTAWLTGAWA
jgi:superfamily I DNA/RNA helicase